MVPRILLCACDGLAMVWPRDDPRTPHDEAWECASCGFQWGRI